MEERRPQRGEVSISVAQMHDLYLKKFEPEVHAIMQRGEPAIPNIKYEYYLEYFKTNFNLSFGVPKTDTCATCDELNVKIDDEADPEKKQTLQDMKQAHIRESQQFYAEMRTCSAMAKENRNIACVSFDFEQNLPLPRIPTNDIFYLRQLWLYVFCVHDCANNVASMYSWPETIAHRGANEVVSCLDHFFKSLEGVDTLLLFSDSCGGQNKNSIVIYYLFSIVRAGLFRRIQHFFPSVVTLSCPVIGTSQKQRGRKGKLNGCTFQNIGLMSFVLHEKLNHLVWCQ